LEQASKSMAPTTATAVVIWDFMSVGPTVRFDAEILARSTRRGLQSLAENMRFLLPAQVLKI